MKNVGKYKFNAMLSKASFLPSPILLILAVSYCIAVVHYKHCGVGGGEGVWKGHLVQG